MKDISIEKFWRVRNQNKPTLSKKKINIGVLNLSAFLPLSWCIIIKIITNTNVSKYVIGLPFRKTLLIDLQVPTGVIIIIIAWNINFNLLNNICTGQENYTKWWKVFISIVILFHIFVMWLRWFLHNFWAIMAKIKSPKNPLIMVIL